MINPFDAMDYQGAFRLPDDDGMGEEWAYAHRGLTFYPDGNSEYNPASELPGSLFAVNLNDEIGEISIPIPVDSDNAGDLPRATTLQDPVDLWPEIYSGSSTPDGGADKTLAIGYHPAANGIDEYIYYAVSNYYGTDPDAPCMGRFDLDLTEGVGAWHVGAAPPDNVFPGPDFRDHVFRPGNLGRDSHRRPLPDRGKHLHFRKQRTVQRPQSLRGRAVGSRRPARQRRIHKRRGTSQVRRKRGLRTSKHQLLLGRIRPGRRVAGNRKPKRRGHLLSPHRGRCLVRLRQRRSKLRVRHPGATLRKPRHRRHGLGGQPPVLQPGRP